LTIGRSLWSTGPLSWLNRSIHWWILLTILLLLRSADYTSFYHWLVLFAPSNLFFPKNDVNTCPSI
jgi:hypothetical protein